MLQRKFQQDPAGRLLWENPASGDLSRVQPIAHSDIRGFPGAAWYPTAQFFIAIEWNTGAQYPLIARIGGDDGKLVGMHDGVQPGHRDLAAMRSDPIALTDYYWSGDRTVGAQLGLDASRFWSYDWGWVSSWKGWEEVLVAPGVRLFKRRATSGRRVAPPKTTTRKKQKGVRPLVSDRAGVPLGS